MRAYIYLTAPINKNMCFQIYTKDRIVSEAFVEKVQFHLNKKLHWFWQCGSQDTGGDYHQFEFWLPPERQVDILEGCLHVLNKLNEYLQTNFELNLEEPTNQMFVDLGIWKTLRG